MNRKTDWYLKPRLAAMHTEIMRCRLNNSGVNSCGPGSCIQITDSLLISVEQQRTNRMKSVRRGHRFTFSPVPLSHRMGEGSRVRVWGAERAGLPSKGSAEEGVRATFLLIHGLQNFKKLRMEDEFSFSTSSGDSANPAALLMNLISEGPGHGLHVLLTCDTYTNVSRFLGRKALSEFEMRVLFQMSANDSASLIDNPKASTLGLHRALYYNEQEGYLETFRPYALPTEEWIGEVERKLARRLKPAVVGA